MSTFASQEELSRARIGVFGLGVSGRSACRLVKQCGATLIVVNQQLEQLDDHDVFLLQDDERAALALAECDVILLSPGIAREHPVLQLALENNVSVWNETELAFRLLRPLLPNAKWLAITGTNGKTTTVTILGEILKQKQAEVFIGGNIGTPLSDLAYDILSHKLSEKDYPAAIVLELSSFQLESLDSFRPHGSAILNISASHGERYERVRDYAEAKGKIVKQLGAGDVFVSLQNDSWSEKVVRSGAWLWERIDPNQLEFDEELELSTFKPFGAHNLVNLAFAIRLARIAQVSNQHIQAVIDTFSGVPHRLERVFEDADQLILNDSKSTNWASTMAAVRSVRSDEIWGDKALTLVVGGKCRGHNDLPEDELVEHLIKMKVTVAIFGEFAQKYATQMQQHFSDLIVISKFDKIIEQWSRKGVLLFSPGFPSFDNFKSYADRGDQFKKLINR